MQNNCLPIVGVLLSDIFDARGGNIHLSPMPRVDEKIPACGLHFLIATRDGATIIPLLRSLPATIRN